MSNTRFSIALVDADETIFDFYLSEKTALLKTCEAFGIKADDSDVSVYSVINDSLWKELEKGLVTRDELKYERFRRWFRHLSVEADAAAFDSLYAQNLSECSFLLEGAEAFLSNLSEICDIYIVTNGLTKSQRGRMKISPASKYIRKMYVSEEIGFAKPDKRFFDFIFADLDIEDRGKAIIFGDSLTSDMQGGKNAGIKTCLYMRHEKAADPSLCDFSVSDYDSFISLVRG